MPIHTLDLHFLGIPHAIASYAIPHAQGIVLIDCGPGSTIPALRTALEQIDLNIGDVTDVLLTHIHLDHGGAAGWFAQHGARVHVHPKGAPHLIDPEKLIKSASRIYGDRMDELWGEFLPVPEDRLVQLQDREEIPIGGLSFTALDTPGHAEHHLAYRHDDTCFTGDVGGVRLPGLAYLQVPMPPPEFHLEKWRFSLDKLRSEKVRRIAPTHFGIFEDVETHLSLLARELDEVEAFLEQAMPADPPVEEINRLFVEWTQKHSASRGVSDADMRAYEAANPSWMSAAGMQRYWRKHRATA
jgi:glyoxylase-like metal-dependent hydrolase (beta-lactamase superfamily II)